MTPMAEPLPDSDTPLTPGEFAQTAGLDEAEVRELIDYGLLAPEAGSPPHLGVHAALALREAGRLRSDFDLDLFTTGLLARYLARIGDLEAQVRKLRAERSSRGVISHEVIFRATVAVLDNG